LASIVLSAGLLLDYVCTIAFGGWLASSNLGTFAFAVACGFFSVFLLTLGLAGFLHRPVQDIRVLEDRFVLKSEWRFDDRETVIPFQKVWKLYANLKNDFPACFIVWRDEQNRCRAMYFDKEELPDFPSEVTRLGERITVDTESFAFADFVRKDVLEKMGCKPSW
jgi:hypothetical protein